MSDATDQKLTPEQEAKAKAVGAGCAFALILMFLIPGGMMLLLCSGMGSSSGGTSYSSGRDVSAPITYAQEFVRQRLKSPSSASFPWSFDEYNVTDLGLGRWRVSGYVDAQNGFGANVRTRWSVEIQDEGGAWKLNSASIDG